MLCCLKAKGVLGVFDLCEKAGTALLEQVPNSCSSGAPAEWSLSFASAEGAGAGSCSWPAQSMCTPHVPACLVVSGLLGQLSDL